jgi:hypothetical protein
MNFRELCHVKPVENPESINPIDRVSWLWPNGDMGGWFGPKGDWMVHQTKWYNYCRGFTIAIQAGGCCGMYPRMMADKFEVVYTFEPKPLNFFCLVNNCQSENIVKIQAAIGETFELVSMRICNENIGMNHIAGGGFIPQLMIDCLNLPKCDLIALDLEGTELAALRGAQRTIEQFKPVIVIEAGMRHDIKAFLEGFGYAPREASSMDTIYSV